MSDPKPESDLDSELIRDLGAEMSEEIKAWRAKKKAEEAEIAKSAKSSGSEKPHKTHVESRKIASILSTTSREFRDSIQNIQGFLEILLAGKVADERQAMQFLGIAHRECQSLSHRVSDLQTASLIEADKLRVRLTSLSLETVIRTVITEVTPFLREKGVTAKIDLPADLPAIQGDEILIQQVMMNLVEAALNGTQQGGQILIGFAESPNGIMLQVAGMAEGETLDSKMLTKAGKTKPTDVATMGLGLYVAKQIVKAHDGGITALTIQGGPTLFNVSLPLHPKSRRRGKILVVEDNLHLALLIEFSLEKEGYKTFKAINGLQALEIAKNENVDLVILDIMLPGIDGFEVCSRLRASPETASTRVIMISAKAREEDRATALRVGADAYYRKPLGMNELISSVETLLEDSS
jgi:CheY-like chemotaxis protein